MGVDGYTLLDLGTGGALFVGGGQKHSKQLGTIELQERYLGGQGGGV